MQDAPETIALTPAFTSWPDPLPAVLFIDLNKSCNSAPLDRLPPVPVIGLGDPDHPLAKRLDCLVEAPASAKGMAEGIFSKPDAAAVLVGLLRAIEGVSVEHALFLESLAYGALQASAGHGAWLATRRAGDGGAPGRVDLVREGGHLEVCLDRPSARNAIDVAMRDALREAFDLAATDPQIESVLLTGRGRAFCIGADLAEFGTTRDPARAHAIRMRTLPAHTLQRCADKLTARIDGAAIGAGVEMAAFARRIEASRKAFFQLPELAMGLIPGAGGCVSLSRRIGRQRAALMVLSGRRVSAERALDWGLVDAIVD